MDSARLGNVGVWTSYYAIGEEDAAEAAALAESLGYGTFWLGGSPRLPRVRPLLEATRQIVVGTGVVNVWQYDPTSLAAERSQIEAEFPRRLLLGIGPGHREMTKEYATPLRKMNSFLDALDAAHNVVPSDARCVAALGPRMLKLSARRGLGTHTYFVPVEHTRYARELLGSAPLIAAELACVLDEDPVSARAIARAYARLYLGLRNYTNNLRRFGYGDNDIVGEGSDRLIDAIVPHGSAAAVAAVARAHLAAGANHVCLQPLGVDGIPIEGWSALAGALITSPGPSG
jgi:probable F420-dependent oxidoreductase